MSQNQAGKEKGARSLQEKESTLKRSEIRFRQGKEIGKAKKLW